MSGPIVYRGWRPRRGDCVVVKDLGSDHKSLPLYLEVMNHSPTGFEWGYGGSGPSQLALAILVDRLGYARRAEAMMLHQAFKITVIAKLDRKRWSLPSGAVDDFIASISKGRSPC